MSGIHGLQGLKFLFAADQRARLFAITNRRQKDSNEIAIGSDAPDTVWLVNGRSHPAWYIIVEFVLR